MRVVLKSNSSFSTLNTLQILKKNTFRINEYQFLEILLLYIVQLAKIRVLLLL